MNEQHDETIEKSYDFSRGVRSKHHLAMRQGYQVTIHQEDGSTLVKKYVMPPNAVVLEDDVFAQFPSSTAVNQALRTLMPR